MKILPPWQIALPVMAAAGAAGVGLAAFVHRDRPGPHYTLPERLGDFDYLFHPGESAGVVVALHDHGSTPQEILDAASSSKLSVVAPWAREGYVWFSPGGEGPGGAPMPASAEDAAAELVTMLEDLRDAWPGNVYIAGHGAGADVAYALAADARPGLAQKVIGSSGRLPSGPVVTPTLAIHGRNDARVPYQPFADAAAQRVSQGEPLSIVPLTNVTGSFTGALLLRWIKALQRLAT